MSVEVSVIIPTFNRANMLRECISSVLAEQHAGVEVIVVDDGSKDETPIVAQEFGNLIHYLRVENGGKPRAVNWGVAHARGKYLWLLDDDDLATPNSVEQRLATLNDFPQAAFVYAGHRIVELDPHGRTVKSRLYSPPQVDVNHLFSALMKDCFFSLSSCLISREQYLALGGLDPELPTGEDYDFQIRLTRISLGAYCPYPALVVRNHDGVRAAGAAASARERDAVLRRDNRLIGRRVRSTVDLDEYDPHWRVGVSISDEQHVVRSYLHRILVMCNNGCLSEAMDDLDSLTELISDPEFESAFELVDGSALLKRAIGAGWAWAAWVDEEHVLIDRFMRSIKAAHEAKQTIAVRAFAVGFILLARGRHAPLILRWRRFKVGLRLLMACLRVPTLRSPSSDRCRN